MRHYKEHIYSLEDRQESDISPSWQILQVLFFTCCIIFGYSNCYTFGQALNVSSYYCLLYSNLSFYPNSSDIHDRFDNIKGVLSEFPTIYCDLVLYIPMVVSTFACFFAVMFAYVGRGGAGNQRVQEAWRIITPTLFFNLISLCLIGYTTKVFQSGLKEFLREVATAWDVSAINLEEINLLRLDNHEVGANLIKYFTLTKHTSLLNVSFWTINFLWILLRLLFNVDFQLVRTTIHVYPKKPNIVLRMDSSVSETSERSPPESPRRSVRFRTVQFTPSTLGLKYTSQQRQDSSSEAVEDPQEIEIAKVDYSKK